MSEETDTKKWAIDADARVEEFDTQFTRLVGLGVVRHSDRNRLKEQWVAAKYPPVVSFIRQSKVAMLPITEDA